MAKTWTGKTLREAVGVGSVIDTHHEGETRRPTEVRLDNFSPKTKKTPADFFRELAEKARLGRVGREGESGQ